MENIFLVKPENKVYHSPTPGQITLMAGFALDSNEELTTGLCNQIKSGSFNAVGARVSDSQLQLSLWNCRNYGLKLFVNSTSLPSNASSIVNSYKNNSGLGGWLLDLTLSKENNNDKQSPIYNTYQRIIYSYDTENGDIIPPVFIGLSGYWEWFSKYFAVIGEDKKYKLIKVAIPDIAEYLANFEEFFQPNMFPLVYFPDINKENGFLTDIVSRLQTFYQDLLYFSYISKYTAIPFWLVCRCQAFNNILFDGKTISADAPTLASVRSTVFSALAYGAQGIYYWNYKQVPGFTNAPVDSSGNKTPTWDLVQTVNKEVQNFNQIFAGCEMIETRHLLGGVEIEGINRFYYNKGASNEKKYVMGPMDEVPEVLNREDYNILFSHIFKNEENYLIVVCDNFIASNTTSPNNTTQLKLHFSEYWSIQQISHKGSGYQITTLTDFNPTYTMNPGDYLIFRWR